MSRAWRDAFEELWVHAAYHRGLREVSDQWHGTTLLRQWPRTCGADVIAIASVVDPILRAAPTEPGGPGTEHKWRRCDRELASVALRDPNHEYHHNREFWSALVSSVAYLASVDEPVPGPMWQALLTWLALQVPQQRAHQIADTNDSRDLREAVPHRPGLEGPPSTVIARNSGHRPTDGSSYSIPVMNHSRRPPRR